MPVPLLCRLVPDTVTPFAVLVPRCAPAPATGWLLVAPRGLSEEPVVVLLQADNASARATRTGAASARERDTGKQGITSIVPTRDRRGRLCRTCAGSSRSGPVQPRAG